MATSPNPSAQNTDDCTICLNSLAPGTTLLTLSCNHKFHLQCLAANIQASNEECPLCRTKIDPSVLQLLKTKSAPTVPAIPFILPVTNVQQTPAAPIVIPSVEDLIDEAAATLVRDRVMATRQATIEAFGQTNNLPMITATTTLEYAAQSSQQQSNIFGLVTLEAPTILSTSAESDVITRVPLDLVCVVDQSGSMSGEKITLLKQTLVYIIEQLNEQDRLAIISFNTLAFDRSHGLKRINQENQNALKAAIQNEITSTGGTFIGSGLQMGIDLLTHRQTKNPLSAVMLLTDGQDNERHDYNQLMSTLPEGVQCHTFGYGSDHEAPLLVQIAQQGNGGSFTYIDEHNAVASAFATVLGGLFSCIAQQIQVKIEFNHDYQVTNFHSAYTFTPAQLPSNTINVQLANLNADEQRNLVFRLAVPELNEENDVDMASSQQPMSQDATTDEQASVDPSIIGYVSMIYNDPICNRSVTTNPVPFRLLRLPEPSAEQLQVNALLDRQRNRVETVNALEQAMAESDFTRSREILQAQVERIKNSVSAQDPFCQELIRDLQHSYPTENAYRSSHHNTYRCQQSERGTYFPASNTSSEAYRTRHQMRLANHIQKKYFK